MTPPASTEPMYLISESRMMEMLRLLRLCESYKEYADVCEEKIRARGPVVQQAPAAHYCTHLKWLTQIEGDGDYRCELGNKTSCEWCEGKSRCGDYQSVHDAALIAQEREKWERERDQKYVLTLSALREISADVELKDYRKSCIHDPVCQWLCTAGNCPFHIALDRHNATIAARAREDVLDRLIAHFEGFADQKRFAYSASDMTEYVENFKKRESLAGLLQNECPAGGCSDEENCPAACRVKQEREPE